MQLARWSWKQAPWPFFALRRLPESRLGHIRRLSLPAFSSRTAERSSDGNAESSCTPSAKDAAISHAVARSNAPLRKPGPQLKRIITTLDPRRLDPGCFMDISSVTQATVNISFPDQDYVERVRFSYHEESPVCEGRRKHMERPFPAGTRGFLYHHAHQKDPLHLQLRFRVTENSDLASFSRGHDLVYDKGYLWCLYIATTASQLSVKQSILRRLLVYDGFIDEMIILDSPNLVALHRGRLKRTIATLEEPFVLDISLQLLQMVVNIAGQMHRFTLIPPYALYIGGRHRASIYDEGSALCRFERSTLPEHAGKHVIVIRLLKILNPPKLARDPPRTAGITLPAEGELFAKHGHVWCRDLAEDTRLARALRLLYDADNGQDAGSHGRK